MSYSKSVQIIVSISKRASELYQDTKQQLSNWGDAMRAAAKEYKKDKVKAALKAGKVILQFVKKSTGELVTREATLNSSYFSYEYSGSSKPSNPKTLVYWDLTKNAFRSLLISNLKSFNPA